MAGIYESRYEKVFESDNISFVEVSQCLVNDYLEMVNDESNYTHGTGIEMGT